VPTREDAPSTRILPRQARLDARHRTQAHVEDRVKQFKGCGARTLPSIDYDRNSGWLQLAALATSLTAWLRHLALDGELAKASTKTLRFRVFSAPAWMITHARQRILKIPPDWAWSTDLAPRGNACKHYTRPDPDRRPDPTTRTTRPSVKPACPPEPRAPRHAENHTHGH